MDIKVIDYLQKFEQLRKKADDARANLIKRHHYNKKDYRITIFEQIARILIYHNINMTFIYYHILSPSYISNLFHTTGIDSERIKSDYISRNRHSLVIFMQSVLEAYYIEICSSLKLSSTQSFSQLLTILFYGIKVDKNSDYYKVNYILSKIRNTLHNNGIHRHKNESVEYKGIIHQFELNKPQNSADYNSIILMTSDIIDFLFIVGKKSSHVNFIDNNGFSDI